jgi:hypothetical protein
MLEPFKVCGGRCRKIAEQATRAEVGGRLRLGKLFEDVFDGPEESVSTAPQYSALWVQKQLSPPVVWYGFAF